MGDSTTPSKGQLLDTDLQLLDMAPFGRKVIAFNKLIRRELELMNLVLPLEFHQEVLNIIVSSSLQEISNDAAKILIQLDESLKVPEYGALLELCPAIGQLKSVSSPIVHALRLASDKNRSTIQKIIRDLELKGSDILDDFEDNVKSGLGLKYNALWELSFPPITARGVESSLFSRPIGAWLFLPRADSTFLGREPVKSLNILTVAHQL